MFAAFQYQFQKWPYKHFTIEHPANPKQDQDNVNQNLKFFKKKQVK